MIRRALTMAGLSAIMAVLGLLAVSSATAAGPAPDQVGLTLAPEVLKADGRSYMALYVQALDANGVPRRVETNTTVQLDSSNPFVLSVPDEAVIPSGSSFSVVRVSTTLIAGAVTITASAGGRRLASVQGLTSDGRSGEGVTPFRILLDAAPNTLIKGSVPPGSLTLTLVDANGHLLPAAADIEVDLQSSGVDTLLLPDNVVVRRGEASATVGVEPLEVGTTTLSAISQGYETEFIEVSVAEAGGEPHALRIAAVQPLIAAATGGTQTIAIQALDTAGVPTYFPCGEVSLASSVHAVINVTRTARLVCAEQTAYAIGTLSGGTDPGSTTITAAIAGLQPATTVVTRQARTPFELVVSVAPGEILAPELTPGFIVLQLLDDEGAPVSFHRPIDVSVAGGDLVDLTSTTIPTGSDFVALPLRGPLPTRPFELWALSDGLFPSSTEVRPAAAPLTVELLGAGTVLFPEESLAVAVSITSNGAPVPDATVSWRQRRGVLEQADLVTDERGNAEAEFLAHSVGDGLVRVEIKKPGYATRSVSLVVPILGLAELDAPPPPTVLGVPIWLALPLAVAVLGSIITVEFAGPGFRLVRSAAGAAPMVELRARWARRRRPRRSR
ncbi:MAG: hypothetical protein V3S98_06070 [Dehalococcoidia bacterium]